jgi:hypothetical protein
VGVLDPRDSAFDFEINKLGSTGLHNVEITHKGKQNDGKQEDEQEDDKEDRKEGTQEGSDQEGS